MTSENGNISIVIADPQYLTAFALETILKEKYEIAFNCNTAADLLKWLETGHAGLLIMDRNLPDLDIKGDLVTIRQSVPRILLLSNEMYRSDFTELNAVGIENIVLKSTDREELFHAVENCLRGKKYYSDEILQMIVENNSSKNISSEFCQLTSSEMEIVKLIAEGLTTKEIAAKKFISFHTVMTHRKNIFRKAAVNSISELIMYAIRAGWIDNIEYYI
jgi:DNA-binding NarL/FixJ family response regulator